MKDFADIGSFVSHLATLQMAVAIAERKGLKKVATIIEKSAKRKIGSYQSAVGPFQDWADLADSTIEDKESHGFATPKPLLRTGGLRESITHEVHGLQAVIGSKLDIAAYQEFGTEKIPPRPFIGPAAFENKGKIERVLGQAIVQGIFSGQKIHESLGYDFKTE